MGYPHSFPHHELPTLRATNQPLGPLLRKKGTWREAKFPLSIATVPKGGLEPPRGSPPPPRRVNTLTVRNGNLNPPNEYLKGHMGSFAESGESIRHGPDARESMSYCDDSNGTDPKQTPNRRPDPAESNGPTGWLNALNLFLERAFLEADRDTGC